MLGQEIFRPLSEEFLVYLYGGILAVKAWYGSLASCYFAKDVLDKIAISSIGIYFFIISSFIVNDLQLFFFNFLICVSYWNGVV